VSDRVQPAVHADQPSSAHAMLDRTATDAGRPQLSQCHQATLTGRARPAMTASGLGAWAC
jgi:hypothetical protein